MGVNPIPENYPRVCASLAVAGASAAIEWYQKIFGAEVRLRFDGPDGMVGHSELAIGDSIIMVADEFPDMGHVGPKTIGGTAVTMSVYVGDVDATYALALESGATVLREVVDQFYGDRSGQFEDPWGHHWSVASHIKDVSEAEMHAAAAAMGDGG